MSSPWASTHASASWPGVQSLSAAISLTRSTSSRLRAKFSPWKRGLLTAEVVGLEVLRRRDLAGQKAAAERAVGDEADPELTHGVEDLVLGIARPQRVLGLQRRDRVDRVRAADRLGRRLRQPEEADLAGVDQLGHRADGLLDRHPGVDPVLVVEVDVVDGEAPQRRVAGARARTRADR